VLGALVTLNKKMDDLNKNQIILLALLISFVSSVATSIMTYSLLVEAPPTVTQTINRVVERTVETVVPQQTRDVVTREVTVVVQEEDLVIGAIAKNESSTIRIFNNSSVGKTFSGLGLLIDTDGTVVTGNLNVAGGDPNTFFDALLPDGSTVRLNYLRNSENFSFFGLDLPAKELEQVMKPTVLGNSDNLQLGQTVISMRGEEKTAVSIGRIISFVRSPEDNKDSKFTSVETDIPLWSNGGPVLNLKGELVGVHVGVEKIFVPSNILGLEKIS